MAESSFNPFATGSASFTQPEDGYVWDSFNVFQSLATGAASFTRTGAPAWTSSP